MTAHDPTVAASPAYISFCRECGGMTGACADDRRRRDDVAAFVAEAIRYGSTLERKTAADVWAAEWCTCPTFWGNAVVPAQPKPDNTRG